MAEREGPFEIARCKPESSRASPPKNLLPWEGSRLVSASRHEEGLQK